MIAIALTYFEKGFNYSQDGPGNRLVYHLSGCNMFCPWCSNPEGMNRRENHLTATVCEAFEDILSCRPMFFEGGGVTFTGGECTLQAKPLCELISKLCAAGIHTAIESNASTSDFVAVATLCDYVIVDFKHPYQSSLSKIGGKLSAIKENIFTIAKQKPIHIRIPLIHGFNDDDNALEGFCEFFGDLKKSGADFDLELLCYHEYGKEKWKKLGLQYTVENGHITKETLKKFQNAFLNLDNTIVTALMFTASVTSIARYVIMAVLHMIDTYWALFLPSLASTLGVFLCIQNLNSFPNEILESGKLDGAGEYKILLKLVIPNIKPVVATMVIFQFQSVWNQTGGTLIYNEALKPLAKVKAEKLRLNVLETWNGESARVYEIRVYNN